ncbi:MAG: hypothetical protein HOP95_05070 [Sphingomonas sp.]|nr:hypothetical protein [Sphingomonas sp.]
MHYFFEDLLGLAAATPLAVLLMLVPGFGLAELLARARVIRNEGANRTCWGLLLGPVLLPALDALLVRWLGFGAMLVLHLGLAGFGGRAAFDTARWVPGRWWAAIAFAWVATAWANVDFDWNGRLYQSQYVVDTVKHAAVVGSLAQHGIPLHDPFFARAGPSGYYYYFYIAPALIHWMAAAIVDSRAAFAAASFATLIAFPAMLLLVAQEAALIPSDARRRFVGVLLFLCCLSGFDLLPGLWMWFQYGRLMSDLDWWSEEIRWTLSSILFEPHHMTAVMAVFAGALLLSTGERASLPLRALAGGFAFATAFGCSVWIVVGAAPALAIWWLWERAKLGTANIWALPLSGVVALLVSLPQIADIRAGRAPSGPPLAFFVRPVGPVRVLPHGVYEWIAHLAVLPGGYLIEFGVFALGALAFLMRGRLAESRATPIGRLLLVSAPVALLLVTFLRSSIMYNDFGWRAVWLAQLPALLWTASVLASRREPLTRSPAWSAALALGLVASVWDMAGLRLCCPEFSAGFVNAHPAADYDSRGAYQWVDRSVSASVVVQHNPAAGPRAMDFGLYSDRPVAVADGDARLFGAAEPAVQSRVALLTPIFDRPMPAAELHERAAAASVGGFLLTSVDPLWRANDGPPSGWTCQYRSAHSCVMLLEKLQ